MIEMDYYAFEKELSNDKVIELEKEIQSKDKLMNTIFRREIDAIRYSGRNFHSLKLPEEYNTLMEEAKKLRTLKNNEQARLIEEYLGKTIKVFGMKNVFELNLTDKGKIWCTYCLDPEVDPTMISIYETKEEFLEDFGIFQ